ncbi:bifunctional dihydroorotate dehydrogenase B NAD binding subunit/NADPH-dependent glutamate synthase [candidate division KSB1 bacterium]|nr:bifunctional dihydroorotate dehydrogenase B NAD binding subunit/NADPH-dependent glutamate synthase [candidate division KSB1 bacterium]
MSLPAVFVTVRLNEIIERRDLAPSIVFFKIYAPDIAKRAKAGQFVVVRGDDFGERVPLTIADFNRDDGTITLIIQEVGSSTQTLCALNVGDSILDVVGPLGHASDIQNFGTVVCVGGGVGIAPVHPIAKALHEAGNNVISIIGARSKDMLFFEDEMHAVSSELHIATDDGSYGQHGFVTTVLQELMDKGTTIDRVVAIGPVVMMRAVSAVTQPGEIPTIVSLNSIMVDGTGMCGGCRASIGNEIKFVCVDGPEFDGHKVDFNELIKRQSYYADEEKIAREHHQCKLEAEAELLKRGKERIPMPHQDPIERSKNFDEVALGYTLEMARQEAARCLQCKKKPCVSGCPVNIDIPAFIANIRDNKIMDAIRIIKQTNSLPAVCGRVCPQEEQCEQLCILEKKGQPIAIGRLERFAADWEPAHGEVMLPSLPAKSGKKVAVVGAGPAGLTVAGDLIQKGHDVTVFEALHKAGGVLVYGIPEFRLPKAIVQREVDYVKKLGVEIKVNAIVGQTIGVDELLNDGYDAMFIGTGAGLPYFMGIPGENLNGVYSANEFLTRNNLMKSYRFPEYATPIKRARNVAVIGGGNVAMDAARVAKRLGADNVYLVYRRSRTEMPAREEEIVNAEEEGIDFRLLTNPVGIIGDERGWVKGIECIQMELGEPDASGRRRPVPIKGSEHVLDVDVFVCAIGQGPNPMLTTKTPDIELNKWGNIVADAETGKTSKKGVFAGGDIVTGAATVILAMGAGKKAAEAIDKYLIDGMW